MRRSTWYLFLVLAGSIFGWALITIGDSAAKANRKAQDEYNQCAVFKHQKEAEKFLDMDCQRYVRYKQDNN